MALGENQSLLRSYIVLGIHYVAVAAVPGGQSHLVAQSLLERQNSAHEGDLVAVANWIGMLVS